MIPDGAAHNFHKDPEFETIQLHGGHSPDPITHARAVPIFQTTSFTFENSQHGADLFALRKHGNLYSRVGNPTVDVFEKRMAMLEGGASAVAASSGQSAEFMAVAAICDAGDNVIASSHLYGGSYNLLKVLFKKFGIHVKFVPGESKPEDYAKEIDENTRAIYVESIANPKCSISDIPALAKMAHENGLPLIVDNTLSMGGYLINPIKLGADIVTHSATKWIGGHGTTLGGIVIDGGKFDWAKSGRHKSFTEPNDGYHGMVYAEHFGKHAFAAKVRLEILRDLGSCLPALSAFMLLQGIETLSLRAERHCQNALALAQYLEAHPKVGWVSYPGLPSHPSHERAKELLREGMFCGMITFGVKVDKDPKAGSMFVDNLRLASNLANVGDAKTLVIHPGSTTHEQLTEEEKISTGVTPDLIRCSVGLENIKDIIADFEAAFKGLP